MAENIQQNPTANPPANPPADTPTETQAASQPSYERFGPGARFEHVILILTFTGLALTGIPQRYADASWAQGAINLMGGIESIRILHRILAAVLMAEVIYHGGVVTYKLFVLGRRASMMPGMRDITDVFKFIGYNLGLTREHPNMPRFNFGEKAEYLAVVWGTVIMVITGFMLWNPIATASVLPGEIIPAALAAHSAEALLAVLSIITWHMYNVHVKRFNRSMFTGNISHEEMVEEHGEELERIQRGDVPQNPPPDVFRRRMRLFVPYAFIMGSLLTIGLIWFVTFEDTAIETIDPVAIDPDAPLLVSADVGNPATGGNLWMAQECQTCHGENAEGAPGPLNVPLANTSLSFEAFVEAVRSGPADMRAYSRRDISDEEVAHIYAWVQSLGVEQGG